MNCKERLRTGLSLIALALLFALVFAPLSSAATAPSKLTASWQIAMKNGYGNTTTTFESTDKMNLSILPPMMLQLAGVRSLSIYSQRQESELARYYLGYYSSGNQTIKVGNDTEDPTPRNISVNLASYSLSRGDTLMLNIVDPANVTEFSTAVTIEIDIDAIINNLRNTFAGQIYALQNQITVLKYELGLAIDTVNRYIVMVVVLVGILAAYVTREKWFGKKRKGEEEKAATEFEQFMMTFITERYETGDRKKKEPEGGEGDST
jgi:hypothetical protein